MKKFFTSLSIALMALAIPSVANATLVMGAGKPQSQVTAFDIEGKYALNYYSLIVENGNFLGDLLSFLYMDIEAIDETSIVIHNFYHEDCEPIDATFDPETMTITVPNNYDLGTWRWNKGMTNETSFHIYLRLYDMYAPQANTLSDNDIKFVIDREKRTLRYDQEKNDLVHEQLMCVNESETTCVQIFKWIKFDYTNWQSEYNSGESTELFRAPHFADYNADKNVIYAYNFNCEGWYDRPVEWVLNADHTQMTATDQYYLYDPSIPDFNFWISEAGQVSPYQLTGEILNGENGYEIKFPTWTYYDRYGRNFKFHTNYKGVLQGELFGPTCEKPVIYPAVDDFVSGDKVTITAPEGAEIYYTIDGSVPTEQSISYTNPFTVADKTCVKAIAVVEGKLPSFVTVANYAMVGVDNIVADNFEVYVENGKVLAPEGAVLFNLNGQMLDINDTHAAGVYVVVYAGKSVKVFVK